jgi:MOSC domain-containing protein YiiM
MQSHEAVELEPGLGIPGDRYATGQGKWSDPRWPDQELTLVEAEMAERVGVEASALRRNIVTRGIVLETLIGREFQIGGARLLGVRPCDPCRYLASLTRPGITSALKDKGGLRAKVVQGGTIAVGDPIHELMSAA